MAYSRCQRRLYSFFISNNLNLFGRCFLVSLVDRDLGVYSGDSFVVRIIRFVSVRSSAPDTLARAASAARPPGPRAAPAVPACPRARGPLANSPGRTIVTLDKRCRAQTTRAAKPWARGAVTDGEREEDQERPCCTVVVLVSSSPSVAQTRPEDPRRGRVPPFSPEKGFSISFHCSAAARRSRRSAPLRGGTGIQGVAAAGHPLVWVRE